MQIKSDHSFVDANGLVRSVYFHNWTFPTSNLNEMAHDMAIQFGSEPPLFTKPAGWIGPPATNATSTPLPPATGMQVTNAGVHSQALGRPPVSGITHVHNPLQAGQEYVVLRGVWLVFGCACVCFHSTHFHATHTNTHTHQGIGRHVVEHKQHSCRSTCIRQQPHHIIQHCPTRGTFPCGGGG